MWTIFGSYDYLMIVVILFGYHGNIQFKKKLNDISSKTTEAVWL